MPAKDIYCPRCKAVYPADRLRQMCDCGGPVLVRYDEKNPAARAAREELAQRPHTIWRYKEMLPLDNPAEAISLGEGMSPLLPLKRLGRAIGLPELLMKDDSVMPTGTFKARGAAVGVSRARELGVTTLAMPTNGNAGGAWAAYCARAGLRAVLVMSTSAPAMNRKEIGILGSSLFLVDGLITDAGAIVKQAIEEHGWFDAATFKEPYRIEGKKTLGYEIAEQCGWEVPDAILVPCGGGLGIIGAYKAMREMQELGWITKNRLPRLIAVQSAGCAPIVRAFHEGKEDVEFWQGAKTCAFGITAPRPLGAALTLAALRKSDGYAVAVEEKSIMEAQRRLAHEEGCWVCPEGAATIAAAQRLRKEGWLTAQSRVVVLNTGTGLKYPELADDGGTRIRPGDSII